MDCRVSSRAEADLDDIWLYVAKETGSLEAADRLVDSITERFAVLANFPYLGRTREDLGPDRRSLAVGEHVAVYLVKDDSVLILRVVHGRRHPRAFFD